MPELIDRITLCLRKFAPKGGTYTVLTRPDGTMRLELTNADGDKLGGNGPSLDAALAVLEARLV
jgi:hypothetical protein